MRFGGYNEELFAAGHKQKWINTVKNDTWELMIDQAGWHNEMLWSNMPALINPGYPHIAMPKEAFDKFKTDVLGAYPDEAVTCHGDDWCYFFKSCKALEEKMPDLKFSFKTNDGDSVTYNVPPKSFLY